MWKSNFWSAILASGVVFGATASAQALTCKPADKSLAGIYELVGVREVGSAIQLLADGRFGYMMTYGAADELGKGCWTRKGNTVTLVPSELQINHGGEKFKKLDLKLTSKGGLLRKFDAKHQGVYERRAK